MSEFSEVFTRINRIPGVRGSMVVAAHDGLVVDSDLMIGVPGPAVAALAASLFARARSSLDSADLGSTAFAQIEADRGLLFVVAPPDERELVLVVIAESWVNVGLVRLETGAAAEALR